MKRVVVDLDGVLFDWSNPFHALLRAEGEMQPLPPDGPVMWNWFTHYGATPAMVDAAHAKQTAEWWKMLPPHKEYTTAAHKTMETLIRDSEVTFVTARPRGRDAAVYALEETLCLGRAQVIVAPQGRKTSILMGMEPHVIVEDNAPTLMEYAAAERDYRLTPCAKILVARSYNRQWQANPLLTLCSTTTTALQMALKVANED